MHTKPFLRRSSRRLSKVLFANEEVAGNGNTPTSFKTKLFFNETLDDTWIEEETLKRDHNAVERLSSKINKVLVQNPDMFLSFCPDLPNRISEEVSSVSRDEPGGVSSCRVRLNVVTKGTFTEVSDDLTAQMETNPSSLCLGSASLTDNEMIVTFEINVFLFPSTSVLSKLQSIISSISIKGEKETSIRFRNISLLPDFVIAKRKLFRSSNSKPLVIVKSIAR